MNLIKKILNFIKYNLKDKWGFIYLEKSLDDSIFNIPNTDESLIFRLAETKDILKITADIFPYLTEEERT